MAKKKRPKVRKGKRAETINAHDAEPAMFAFRIKMNFFPQGEPELTNTEVGRRLHELMTENDLTFDYDDLEIDVKNDTDAHWNHPWPDEGKTEE